jgi:molecular chaperone HtpG
VLLWNPAIDKVYVIPPNHLLPHGFSYHFCLHGFGYDHVRDDYKVIRHVDYNVATWYTEDISITPLTPDPFWEIYSLRSNSWRKLDIQIRSDGYSGGTEVYLNGVCHWLGEIEDEIFVMSFNLSNDVFFTTRVDWDGDSFLKLVVLNGYVAIISNYVYNDGSYNISISILGEIGVKESWTRLFHVGPLSQVEYPIGAGKKGNIFFRNSVGEVFWFDLTTGVFEKRDDKEKRIIGQIIVYKKNLCPIGGMNN